MTLSVGGFLLFAIALVAIELVARRESAHLAPAGDLFDRVLTSRAARVTIVVFWWWLGWHLFFAQTVDPSGLPVR
ncbi:MAG: DUF6186 family protein [Rhodoglobus sp.]